MTRLEPDDFDDFLSTLSDTIAQRVSESDEDQVSLNDIAMDFGDRYLRAGDDGFEFQGIMSGLLEECLRPLLWISNEQLGGDGLEILDFGADQLFTVLRETDQEPVFGVAAKRSSTQTITDEGLIRIRHDLAWAPDYFPDRIAFHLPLVESDVRKAIEEALHEGPNFAAADRETHFAAFRNLVASKYPNVPEVELNDHRAVASLYADIVLVCPDVDESITQNQWSENRVESWDDTVLDYLDRPDPPDDTEPEPTPATPLSAEEHQHIARSRARAVEEGRYAVVDPSAPGAKEAFLNFFFGHLSDGPIDREESE